MKIKNNDIINYAEKIRNAFSNTKKDFPVKVIFYIQKKSQNARITHPHLNNLNSHNNYQNNQNSHFHFQYQLSLVLISVTRLILKE